MCESRDFVSFARPTSYPLKVLANYRRRIWSNNQIESSSQRAGVQARIEVLIAGGWSKVAFYLHGLDKLCRRMAHGCKRMRRLHSSVYRKTITTTIVKDVAYHFFQQLKHRTVGQVLMQTRPNGARRLPVGLPDMYSARSSTTGQRFLCLRG